MSKYNNPKYEKVRNYIKEEIDKGNDISKIKTFHTSKEDEFQTIFKYENRNWGIDQNDWKLLVEEEWESYQSTVPFKIKGNDGIVFSNNNPNDFEIKDDNRTSWQKFRQETLIKKNKFDEDTIESIERDTLNIISQLDKNRNNQNPVKGLAIGGVQSGKTTSMAAIMAMGADFGFNVFIILSGMIESLREQTENRIESLLDGTHGSRIWEKIDPKNGPGNTIDIKYRNSKNFYMVVLKNKTRLIDLINWIQADGSIAGKLKVLILDDESDQASVNTSRNPENERKTINRLIINLVHNRDINDRENNFNFSSVNYVGYTATPYANILSEGPDEDYSLYPKDFIVTLSKSNSHFGPKEIFGMLERDDEILNILNVINESKDIINFLNDEITSIPFSLKQSVAYFIAASASLRKHEFRKPVSMLIHVSNRIEHHNKVYETIKGWLKNNKQEALELIRDTWEKEYDRVTAKDIIKRVYIDKNNTFKPHNYNEIEDEVNNIISNINAITIDDKDLYNYHEGIHTIVDHSNSDRIGEPNEEFRLRYPSNDKDLDKTPIFLVIGGATLSRGITLEGLVSTYFLRTPTAADTLTQMGRWFGYRINYELYPRIWLTQRTIDQFQYISTLEEELREEISILNELGEDFEKVAPRLISKPQYIAITSQSKSYDMVNAEYDFSGYNTQTYIFDNNLDIQKNNIKYTENFINTLGKPIIIDNQSSSKVFWKDIDFKYIKEHLLKKFKFSEKIKAYKNIDSLFEWIEEATEKKLIENWNIIIGGIGKANVGTNDWILSHFTFNKVARTKKPSNSNDINIGVLRNPDDLYGDIDESKITNDEILKLLENTTEKSKTINYVRIRETLGLDKTPQLVIYRIDKDSQPRSNNREPLGIDSDLIGLFVSIPGQKTKNNVVKVTTKIERIPDEFDIEN